MQESSFTGALLEMYRTLKGRWVLNMGANSYTSYSKNPQVPKKQKYHKLLLTITSSEISALKGMTFGQSREKYFSFQDLLGRTKSKHYPKPIPHQNGEDQNHTCMSFAPATKQLGYTQLRSHSWKTGELQNSCLNWSPYKEK